MMVEIAWSDIIDFYRHQQDLGVHNEQFSKKKGVLSLQIVVGIINANGRWCLENWPNDYSRLGFEPLKSFTILQAKRLSMSTEDRSCYPKIIEQNSGNWYSFKIKKLLLLEPKYHLAGWLCKNDWHGAWLVATKSNGWTLKNKYAIDKFQVWHKLLQPDSSAYKTTSLHSAQILTAWWFISHHSWFHSPKLEPPRVVKLQRCSGSLQGL